MQAPRRFASTNITRISETPQRGFRAPRVINGGGGEGFEGLDKITANLPDLIILDVIMEYDSAGSEVNKAVGFRKGIMPGRNIPISMVSSISLDPVNPHCRASEAKMNIPDASIHLI